MKDLKNLTFSELEEIVAMFDHYFVKFDKYLLQIHARSISHNDGMIIDFSDTRIIKYLYNKGYDISEPLKQIETLSNDFDKLWELCFELETTKNQLAQLEKIKNFISKF